MTIEIKAKEEKFNEIYQMLQVLVPSIRKEKGCMECRIYRDVEDGNVFFLYIRWRQRADLIHFMETSSGSVLLGAIDLLSETSRVMAGENSPWEDSSALKRMRSK